MSIPKTEVPHLYLDTSVLAGVLQKQHTASSVLLDTITKKSWKCSTSAFASMELFDISQDNQYVLNQLKIGVHIKKAYKNLDQKTLSVSDLKEIRKSITDLFTLKYAMVHFYHYGEITWDKALEIKASTNISAPDIIHLATDMEAGCDLLITLDNFFKKEAEPYIKTCLPEQAERVIRELGFER